MMSRPSLRRLQATGSHLQLRSALHCTPQVQQPAAAAAAAAAAAGTQHFDYLVLGAGSGGMASARRAADLYGAKVAIVESGPLGGTCVRPSPTPQSPKSRGSSPTLRPAAQVNVGCVPKKVMWNAAFVKDVLEHADEYGHHVDMGSYSFDWPQLKAGRDGYVERLNGIYAGNLEGSGVTLLEGHARFVGARQVVVDGADGGSTELSADHVLIATGGRPIIPADVPGAIEHGIDSDGFFELEELPRKVAVVGAGYIAVELAGVLHTLGSSVDLFVRKEGVLRSFDADIASFLNDQLVSDGLDLVNHASVTQVDKQSDGTLTLTVDREGGAETRAGYDCLVYAVGRAPSVEGMGLDAIGVKQGPAEHIIVDEYQETGVPGVYALGDVCGIQELTPVAIAAGRRLSDRLFGGPEYEKAKIQYEEVPTVVFSHPPIGTIGMTEAEAVDKFGEAEVKTYTSTFVNMYYSPWQMPPADKPKSYVKMVCEGAAERVVGLHVIGMAADEMIQGFGVGMRMGATKVRPTPRSPCCFAHAWPEKRLADRRTSTSASRSTRPRRRRWSRSRTGARRRPRTGCCRAATDVGYGTIV